MNTAISETVEKGTFKKNQKVKGVVDSFTLLGVNFIINDKYIGLAYKQEIFTELKIGDILDVYIKDIRPDGKIDLTLQIPGRRNAINDARSTVLSRLKDANGFLPYGDKSSPEEIYKTFHMSKKNFKQAIGGLYKQRKIKITPDKIELI